MCGLGPRPQREKRRSLYTASICAQAVSLLLFASLSHTHTPFLSVSLEHSSATPAFIKTSIHVTMTTARNPSWWTWCSIKRVSVWWSIDSLDLLQAKMSNICLFSLFICCFFNLRIEAIWSHIWLSEIQWRGFSFIMFRKFLGNFDPQLFVLQQQQTISTEVTF